MSIGARAAAWSLRTQLYLVVLALSVPVAAWIAYEIAVHHQESVAEDQAHTRALATLAAADVERFLEESGTVLGRLARRPAVAAPQPGLCDAALAVVPTVSSRFDDIVTVDGEGRVLCAARATTAGKWAGAPSPGGEGLAVGSPQRVGSVWAVPLSLSLPDGRGRIIGTIELQRLRPVSGRRSLPDDMLIGLMDTRSGQLLARSREPERHIGSDISATPLGLALRQQRQGVARLQDLDGVDRIFALVPVAGTEWVVYAAVPAAAAYTRTRAYAVGHVMVGAAIVGLMLAFGLLMARRIERPVARIAAAARAIGQGRLDVRVSAKGPRELVDVSHRLNAMLDALHDQRRSIEKSQARLHGVLQNVQEVIYSMTPDGQRFHFVSPACEKLFGHAPGDFYAQPALWSTLVAGEHRASRAEALRDLARSDRVDLRYRMQGAGGRMLWVLDRFWLVRDAAGKPLRIDGLAADITDRQAVEEAMRESEHRFRCIAEWSPVPLAIAAFEDCRIRYVNEALLSAFGLTPEQAYARTIYDFFAMPADRRLTNELLRRDGRLSDLELAAVRADGSRVWVMVSARLADFDGRPAVFVSFIDISARRQAEMSLRASEERFRTLVSALAEGVAVHDAEGRVVTCNAAARRLLGLDSGRARSGGPVHPEWRTLREDGSPLEPAAHPVMLSIATGNVQRDAVIGLRQPGGAEVWLSINTRPLFAAGSLRPHAVVASFSDITDRRRAEQAVRRSEAQLAGIIESAMDAVITIDAAHCVTLFNAAAERMFGYSSIEMIGQPVERLMPARFRPSHHAKVERFRDSGLANFRLGTDGRIMGLRRNGEEFPIEASVSQLAAEGGHFFTVILRDITDRLKWEAAIRELNESLERRVAERTAELEYANKELEGFSYSVSHDLRAPLRSINGFSHILKDTERERLSAEGAALLDRVIQAANRMGQLIDDILRFSRISRAELQRGEVDMQALASSVVEELRETYPRTRMRIGALPRVVGDATMLRQALANLIDNAAKFSMHRTDAEVEVSAEIEGGEAVFRVRDNGAGFDMRYAARLFGVFQRMHNSADFPGTGVGLAVVKRIVERHRGRVWADAEPGRGACFYFALPCPPALPAPASSTPASVAADL